MQAEQDHGGAADAGDAVANVAFRHAERGQRRDRRRGQQAEEHEKQGEAEHEEYAMREGAEPPAQGLARRASVRHLLSDAPAHVADIGWHQRQHARRNERDDARQKRQPNCYVTRHRPLSSGIAVCSDAGRVHPVTSRPVTLIYRTVILII
ncbi:MAG: hypothetical protein M5U29_18550 [Anaerolineae bacterium]|nr:hypothetical protein [Anaerolineae bacterium]